MPTSTVELTLDKPDHLFQPGDNITGTVTLNAIGVVKAKDFYISLTGICATNVIRGRPIDGYGEHKSESQTIEFLRIVHPLDSKSSFSPGEYTYPFSILVPSNCINPRAKLREPNRDLIWETTPLPCSIEKDKASIKYFVNGICTQQQVLSLAIKQQLPVQIASLESLHHQLMPVDTQRDELNVKFYDRRAESWTNWSKRVVGINTATESVMFEIIVEMDPNLKVESDPLAAITRLEVNGSRPDSVVAVKLRIKQHTQIIAKGYINDVTEYIDLYERDFGPSGSLLPLQGGPVSMLVRLLTPNVRTEAFLEVLVTIKPISGSPIIPKSKVVLAPVRVYYSSTGEVEEERYRDEVGEDEDEDDSIEI